MVPPTPMPAAITGSGGGSRRHASVCARSACTRRMPTSSSPWRRSQSCHPSSTPRRNTRVICQWVACGSGTSSARRASQCCASSSGGVVSTSSRSRSSSAISSSSVASAPASAQACSGVEGPPYFGSSRRIIRLSTAWRRSGSTAGGRSSSAGSASSSASSVERPASARMRGSSRARPSAAFRKATRSARAERRVGSRTVTRERRSGASPPPTRRSTPAARQSRKGRWAGMS